jgi:hypothetical protein
MFTDHADMNGYFSIQLMTSVNDPQPRSVTRYSKPLNASINYNYTTNIPSAANVMGRIVKIFKIDSSPTKALALCTVNVISNTSVGLSSLSKSTRLVYLSK